MTNLVKVHRTSENPNAAIELALANLESGGLVAFPTDTVYGLAARLENEEAIERLYEVKGREADKPIPILLPNLQALPIVAAEPGEDLVALAAAYWPGPLTIVVPKARGIPETASRGPTIGVRVPDHPLALRLLQRSGPLAVTSANISGEDPCRTAIEVADQIGDSIDLILDGGQSPGGEASTVVASVAGELRILREGPISLAELQAILSH